ncbi:MAG: hypothetical protein ACE5EQ_11850, partial [Phycisphaerae bacterium]
AVSEGDVFGDVISGVVGATVGEAVKHDWEGSTMFRVDPAVPGDSGDATHARYSACSRVC